MKLHVTRNEERTISPPFGSICFLVLGNDSNRCQMELNKGTGKRRHMQTILPPNES